jgi:HEAT repeat protein
MNSKQKPGLVLEMASRLRRLLRSPDPEVRGHAAWALGEMKAAEAGDDLMSLAADTAAIKIFINGALKKVTVRELAAASIQKIKGDRSEG